MAASDYIYDGEAISEANWIENEQITLNGRGVVPANTAFYSKDIKVEIYNIDHNEYEVLEESRGYSLSPLFSRVSAATGIPAFSYVVITKDDMSLYSHARLSYRVVGEYEDTALLDIIAQFDDTERASLSTWRKVQNLAKSVYDPLDPALRDKNVLELLSNSLEGIKEKLQSMSPGNTEESFEKLYEVSKTLADINERLAAVEENQDSGGSTKDAEQDAAIDQLNLDMTAVENQADANTSGVNDHEARITTLEGSTGGATQLYSVSFYGGIISATSDTWRPDAAQNYSNFQFYTEDDAPCDVDVLVEVYVDKVLAFTQTIPAGQESFQGAITNLLDPGQPLAVDFTNAVYVQLTVNSPTEGRNVNIRLI